MKKQAIPLRKFIHYKNSAIQNFHYLCFQIKQDENSITLEIEGVL